MSETGREFLERLMAGPGASAFGQSLGMRLIALGEGSAVFEVRPGPQHLNPMGAVHGGLHAALMDSAMGCAVQSLMPAGAAYGTVDLKVSYVRRITVETGRILCRGQIIHFGRRVQTAEARIEDEAGKLYAHGSGTFMRSD